MNTLIRKKYMALVGLVWFLYALFHMFSLLNFHAGQASFNDFYQNLHQYILYQVLSYGLLLSLIFHIFIAIQRQLSNNKKRLISYRKPYPKAIPRIVAWLGAFGLLSFLLVHIMQFKLFQDADLYTQILHMFDMPIMWAIYALGVLTLSAHLQHGLGNAPQTLGIGSKQFVFWVWGLVILLFVGFSSIMIGVWYVGIT
jgi:succinate dehydrogenase / fumarate reductase cytochrome b subunit